MNRLFGSIIVLSICCFSIAGAEINELLDWLQADSLLASSFIGISVYDISADSAVFQYQGDKLFTPASNLKLVTSAAALELLGPGFRFKTDFLYRGSIDKKGKLNGDLIIVGGGDPLISGRFRASITEILGLWSDSLKAKGIKEIGGILIVDNSLFTGPELGAAWSWDDLTYWYACPISALSFNDNCVDLKFLTGKKVGDPAIIEYDPVTNYINIRNKAVTLPAESSFTLDYYRTPESNNITFFGGISVSDTTGRIDYVSVYRPELYALAVFNDVLMVKGIKSKDETCSLDDLNDNEAANYSKENLKPLFEWQSDSLPVILKIINTNSQNFFAEQTLRMLEVARDGKGSSYSGIKTVQMYLDSLGISNHDIMMYDGSGLSYMNKIKPDALVKLLAAMSQSRNFNIYYESLANPEKDKAAKSRLKNISNRGNVRAKGGYIAGMSTFSGYVKGPHSGHLIAFSIMINNYSCDNSYTEAWEDSLVAEILKEY